MIHQRLEISLPRLVEELEIDKRYADQVFQIKILVHNVQIVVLLNRVETCLLKLGPLRCLQLVEDSGASLLVAKFMINTIQVVLSADFNSKWLVW